jgi:parallel beta-helix repeat protein
MLRAILLASTIASAPFGAIFAQLTAALPGGGSQPTLAQKLAAAHDGDTVKLSGTFSGNNIKGLKFAKGIVVTSADPTHPAIIRDLSMTDSAGITFDSLRWQRPLYSGPADPVGQQLGRNAELSIAYSVSNSDRVAFNRNVFTSDHGGTLATEGSGLLIRNSTHVTVTINDFSHMHNAFAHWQDDFVTIAANRCHDNRDDCYRGGSSDLVIRNNRCFSNHPDGEKVDVDHPDCIQLWTTGYAAGFHDVKVLNNRYDRGTGSATQTIFVTATGGRWTRMTVSGNTAVGAGANGIAVNGVDGLTLTGNTVISFTDYLSRIIYSSKNDTGLVLTGNVAPRYADLAAKFFATAPAGNSLNKPIAPTTAVP